MYSSSGIKTIAKTLHGLIFFLRLMSIFNSNQMKIVPLCQKKLAERFRSVLPFLY